MSAAHTTTSASGSAPVAHASTGTRPAGQRATCSAANSTTGGVGTANSAAKATTSAVGTWIAGHAMAGMHPAGSIGPHLVRPVVNPSTAAIVYRWASVHRAVLGVADLRESRAGSYERRSKGGQDRELRK
jgi:hypothetical protein